MPRLDLDSVERLVLGCWTGRSRHEVAQHIAELAKLGVAPPPHTPLFVELPPERLTERRVIEVRGAQTSGEVEVLFVGGEQPMIGIGSDHTNRELERESLLSGKLACPKPVASETWFLSDICDHWDQLRLRAFQTFDGHEILHQDALVSAILSPDDLIRAAGGLPVGTVLFSGTVKSLDEARLGANRFRCELIDPVCRRELSLQYDVIVVE